MCAPSYQTDQKLAHHRLPLPLMIASPYGNARTLVMLVMYDLCYDCGPRTKVATEYIYLRGLTQIYDGLQKCSKDVCFITSVSKI
jgi:hypothetical protein